MLQFYALPLSGYCTKVRIVLRIKDISFSETPPLGGHYSSEEYQREMPPGSMPSINHDGFKLFDSEAIVEYLEDCWPNPSMRASDPQQRARERAVAQFHNTRLEPVVRSLFVHIKSPVDSRDNAAIDGALQNFQEQLRKLDQITSLSPFVGGDHPCLADCGFPVTMYMGKDLFAALGRDVSFSDKATDWLKALDAHKVIGQEISNNRTAIADWVSQFA